MMTKMKITLLAAVTFAGAILEAGESLELSERSAKALIDEGKAKPTKTSKKPPVNDSEGGKEPEVGKDANEQTEANSEDSGKISSALDDKYKRDELAEAAKKAGVEFPFDARKQEIIDTVIEAGKADALLAE